MSFILTQFSVLTHLLFLSRPLFDVPVEVTEFIDRDLLLLLVQKCTKKRMENVNF